MLRTLPRSILLTLVTGLVIMLILMYLNESQGFLPISLNYINWLQIPISLTIGFILGIVFTRKRRNRIWY